MLTRNLTFDIAEEVLSLGLTGTYFIITNLRNQAFNSEFDQMRTAVINSIVCDLSRESIETDPVLLGFRNLHEKVGCPGKKNIASPENLLTMLLKNGKLPSINLLVDIYNLVSVESRLAIGAHDINKVVGNMHLRLTDGTENFLPLGQSEPQKVSAGEYAYMDDANDIICRLEVRQVEKTKVTLETTECFFIVQGNANTSSAYVSQTAKRLIDLIKTFCGGTEHILYGSS